MNEPVTAIVTGGAQGIGRGIVDHLLQLGWQVSVFDADEEALAALESELAAYSSQLLTLATDVADEDAVASAVELTVGRLGRLDGLVNNAGIADPYCGPLEELSLSDWQRWLDTNLTGAFLPSKYCLPHLRRCQGAIINMASTRAIQSEPQSEAYAASKGGLLAFTHALAVSESGRVRVNAVSPGWIAVEDYKKPANRSTPQLSETDHAQHPAGRVGRPPDVAALCAFLLSSQAGFITGENVRIDGGMTRKMIYAG
jgi:NAD(P)-dependent dehydrogenase (short-subunit alcohol dehydrogenase family)